MTPADHPPLAIVASHVRCEEREIFAALERRGVPYVHLDDRKLVFRIGEALPRYPVVLNRCLSQTRRRYISLLFEAGGVSVVNSSRVVTTCDDRVAMHLALAEAGLPLPDTAIGLTPSHGVATVEAVGYPTVLKPVSGSWGRLVSRVRDREGALSVLEHRAALRSPSAATVYAQAYIDKPGRDIRALVLGDRVPAAMYRRSEHWVTNVARGARGEPCPVSAELAALASRAAASVGGGAVSVDLMETRGGDILVTEVNSLVEFRALATVTDVDIAGELVDFALSVAGSTKAHD